MSHYTSRLLSLTAPSSVAPELLVAHLGRLAWVSDRDGQVTGGRHGLYAYETRLLSRYCWRLDGEPLVSAGCGVVEPGRVLGYALALPTPQRGAEGPAGSLTERCLALELDRRVDASFLEHLTVINYTGRRARFTLALEVEPDFGDFESAREGAPHGRGRCTRRWLELDGDRGPTRALRFDYEASHHPDPPGAERVVAIARRVEVRLPGWGERAQLDATGDRIFIDLELEPGQRWVAGVEIVPGAEARLHREGAAAEAALAPRRARLAAALERMTTLDAGATDDLTPIVLGALERARSDLAAMRIYELDGLSQPGESTLIAGVPLYMTLFGRDPLTAAWQAALLDRGMLPGTLAELARWQGTRRDDWRNEVPGRMLHEAHTSPENELELNPRGRDYSSITASAFYPVTLASAWHWFGDEAMVRRFLDPALRALGSRERHSLGDDGFYYYHPRSRQSHEHQGWKDSEAAIVDVDGRLVPPHLATCEEQGFTYWGKLVTSEVLWWLGERDLARRLRAEAHELKARFNEVFWLEEEGFFAMARRPDGRLVRSVGSNPGHCVATGIVDDAHVETVVERLFAEDLFSGWGIRTLSCQHPGYNPFSYHRGTVWPVENATFALGTARYGLHAHTQRLARALFEASAQFPGMRLPELFGGQPRDPGHPVPGRYIQANSPQAWSASAVVLLVQSMLGLYPYAPLKLLLVDPHLPPWLPEIRLEGLRVANARVNLRFERGSSGRTRYHVDALEGTLHVVRQPSPWSLTAGPLERLRDAFESLLPGH